MAVKHGGTRPGAGRKPYPAFKPEGIVIDVRDCRAYVSRWRKDEGGARFWLEEAQNWEELEGEANQEVEEFGGYITMSGIYPCAKELADKAMFND